MATFWNHIVTKSGGDWKYPQVCGKWGWWDTKKDSHCGATVRKVKLQGGRCEKEQVSVDSPWEMNWEQKAVVPTATPRILFGKLIGVCSF